MSPCGVFDRCGTHLLRDCASCRTLDEMRLDGVMAGSLIGVFVIYAARLDVVPSSGRISSTNLELGPVSR